MNRIIKTAKQKKNFFLDKTLELQTKLDDNAIVIFDLETTGLSNTAEICQIAAIHIYETFNVYMIPSKGIVSQGGSRYWAPSSWG